MRCLRAVLALALAAFALVQLAPAARAKGPSADQIIESLRPDGNAGGTTRGIRPVIEAAPGDVANGPATRTHHLRAHVRSVSAETAAAPPADPRSVNLHVEFQPNSDTLTGDARRTLDQLGSALSSPALAAFRFKVEGHTDTTGTPDRNLTLSERRAQAVVAYLGDRYGIDRARLDPVGVGQDGLLVATPPGVSEPRNRRVVVVNLGA